MKYRGQTAKMPVWIMPGHPQHSVTAFFGYGRKMAGRVGNAVEQAQQFNAYLLRTSDAPWFGDGLEIAKTGDRYLLATHAGTSPDGRPRPGARRDARGIHARIRRSSPTRGTRPRRRSRCIRDHEYNGYKWGMAIDLTSCTGCGACTIACVAENNIPVVGKEQVARGREMHWIRVDHYFAGDPDNPRVVPPADPLHAVRERAVRGGLPGRRDDAQRRRPERHDLQPLRRHALLLEQLPVQGAALQLPALRRLVHARRSKPLRNPDVTVRSRGVMEKCTYCVQRINHARIDAKKEDRPIRDGEIVTACQAACPADAIVFGDLNDPNSRVAKLKAQQRNYGVLEDLNTRPRTTYLAAIRNPNPELGAGASPRARRNSTDGSEARRSLPDAAPGHRAGAHVRVGHRQDQPDRPRAAPCPSAGSSCSASASCSSTC